MQVPQTYFSFFTRLLKVAGGMYLLGIIFLYEYGPAGYYLLCCSYWAIAILVLIRFLFRKDKKLTDYLLPVCVLIWAVCGYFKLLHWPINHTMHQLASVSFACSVILFFLESRQGKKIERQTLLGLLPALSAGLVILGILLQALHFPAGKSILIMGFFSLAAWFILDWMKEDREP